MRVAQNKETIIQESQTDYNRKMSNRLFLKICALAIFCLTGLAWDHLYGELTCPNCQSQIKFVLVDDSKGIFGETWTCSDPNCGYENYVGINHCGVCGKRR